MGTIKTVINAISWLIIGVFALFVFFSLGTRVGLISNYKSFVVQSGSMEPTIRIGDVIIIKSEPNYEKNDVITFSDKAGRIVTHRIIEKLDGDRFVTRGDANRSIDEGTVAKDAILGRVILVIPKIGYLAAFAKSPIGIFLLIFLPIALLIIDKFFSKERNA